MQGNDKMPIKQKLKLLLLQVKQTKKQLLQLYELHRHFQFSSLIPQESLKRKSKPKHIDRLDKENNLNHLNKSLNNISNTNVVCDQKYVPKQTKKMQSDENFMNIKNQKDQIKDIKADLIMQLCQIKSMEKKSESMRRTNEKINEYNFQQRKSYRESISKDKDNSNKINDSNVSSNYRSNRSVGLQSQNQSLIIDSKISVIIPTVNIPVETTIKTLKCCKGHQFYDGPVNSLDQPHGNGRLQMCCPSLSVDFGGQCFKDSLFYQGQFKDGKFHGFGTLSYKGGVKYVGQFRQGRRHGKGSMYYNGKAEVANWQNDIFVSIM